MRKRKKHKWKYQINVKKKIIVLGVLGVSLFVGLGYALIESNLGFFGRLEYSKYEPTNTLYSALKREVNKGYALKYTGDHQDSMDASKSTEDVYHFYADNDTKGEEIRNKNNVVFANTCWQMIRTTDTGGVRLLYNGEPEITETNGNVQYNCGDTRDRYHVGTISSVLYLKGTYLYSATYTASTDSSTGTTTFTLDDPQSITIDQNNVNEAFANIIENYPYTCKNTTGTCTNNNLYKVGSMTSNYSANVYKTVFQESIGESKFSSLNNSLTYIGYMTGDVYDNKTSPAFTAWSTIPQYEGSDVLEQCLEMESTANVPAHDYYYADSVDWNTMNANQYTLINPTRISRMTDYFDENSLRGKYFMIDTTTSSTVYYVTGNYISRVCYKLLENGSMDYYFRYGDSIIRNNDGTYTLVNPSNPIPLSDPNWGDYFNSGVFSGKYSCIDSRITCENPLYITGFYTYEQYYYTRTMITLAKSVNGLSLVDYVTIGLGEWLDKCDTVYSDYKYTCGNTDTTCTNENLKYIYNINESNGTYQYSNNYKYGNSVKYEDGKYKLQNISGIETMNNESLENTHRYFCSELGATECEEVNYRHYYSRHITLTNGDKVEDALDAMLKKNEMDSMIKTAVDQWYKSNLKDTQYESKIDDTIYCADRSYDTTSGYTYEESTWNPNGGSKPLYFKGYNPTTKIACQNVTDRFSKSNNRAKLDYAIGLMSTSEMNLLGNKNARRMIYTNVPNRSYWLGTPMKAVSNEYSISYISSDGIINKNDAGLGMIYASWYVVRPAISLVEGTKYSQGDGSMTNPYVVDMSE